MSETLKRVFAGSRGQILLIVAGGWLTMMLIRGVIPPLLPSIIDEFSISESYAGIALTIMWAVYSLMHYPAGHTSDSLSHRTVLTAALIVTAIAVIFLTQVKSYAQFLAAVSLVGIGAGLYFAPSRALLSDVFSTRRGTALGVQAAAGTLGSAAAGGLAIAALSTGSWKYSFPPILIAICLIFVFYQNYSNESIVVSGVSFELKGTGRRILDSSNIRIVLVIYISFTFVWTGVTTFLPAFLQASKGLSTSVSTFAYTLVFIVSTITGPLAGNISDQLSSSRVAASGLILGILGILTMLLSDTILPLMIGVVLLAMGFRSFPPVMQSYLLGKLPENSAGGDFGALKSIYTGIGSLGTTYVGFVADIANYQTAFWGYIPITTLSIILVIKYIHE